MAVLAKKLTRERVSVTIKADGLTVTVSDEDGAQEYELSTGLFSGIVVEESRWDLLSTKVTPSSPLPPLLYCICTAPLDGL